MAFSLQSLSPANWLNPGGPKAPSVPTSPTSQDWLATAAGQATPYAPGLNPTHPGLGPGQGGAVLDASTAPAAAPVAAADPGIGVYKGLIGTDQSTLNNLYLAINGGLKTYADDANNQIDTNYGTAQGAADKSYSGGVASTNAAFGSNGAYDSSFRGNADQGLTDAYNADTAARTSAKTVAKAGVGSTIQSVQDQLADKPQYDLSQYTDLPSLQSLHTALTGYIQQLQGTKSSLTPQGDLVKKLNSEVTPDANLDTNLKTKLQGLVTAGTPDEALTPLATSYLTSAGVTDPTQQKTYLDYLKQLTGAAKTQENPGMKLVGA